MKALAQCVILLFAAAVTGAMNPARTRAVPCLGRSYAYTVYSPDAKRALPAVLALHGAGGTGTDVSDVWRPFAERADIVVIAPEVPREVAFEAIAPQVFRCIVEDARKRAKIDTTRIYVFGWSMGGVLAFDAAMFESRYFAGIAVYGAAIGDGYWSILDHAERKIPIAIFVGEHDVYVPLAAAEATRDSLVARGFPVHYVMLAGKTHYFPAVGDTVTADAWRFLSSAAPAP